MTAAASTESAESTANRDMTRAAGRLAGVVAVGAAVVVAARIAGQAGAIVVVLVVVTVAACAQAGRRMAAERRVAAARAVAEDLLAAFAAELDAGADPDTALRAASASATGQAPGAVAGGATAEGAISTGRRAGGGGELARLSAGLAAGEDAARLLAGCETPALRQLGAALWVCRAGGARLAPVATTLAEQARADARRAGELAAALAGPRSSGRLVAGLPLVGVAFAALLGARPGHILLATPGGSACLAAGVALDLLGLRWLRWIGDRAGRGAAPPPPPPPPPAPAPAPIATTAAGRQREDRYALPLASPGRRRRERPDEHLYLRRPRPARGIPRRATIAAVLACATGAGAGVLLAHRQTGPAVAAAVGTAALLVGGALPADPGQARRVRLLADLPLALDLIAACLAAGATVPAALEATAAGVAGPLGIELTAAARGLRLGATTARATARLVAAGTAPPSPLAALWRRPQLEQRTDPARPLMAAASALSRVETSGARLADALTRIAERARAQAHDKAIGAARRAGVVAVAPLGLCFLPAFLLLGVVPTILGSLPGALPA